MDTKYNTASPSDQSDLDLISSLHRGPALLPWPDQLEYIRWIVYISSTITLTHLLFLTAFRYLDHKSTIRWEPRPLKASYQATNLCVNLFLGIYGIYTWTTIVHRTTSASSSSSSSSNDITRNIVGFREFVPFAALQFGYNLWSLPMGLFVVDQSRAMIGHHVATLFVSYVSCFSRCGFRYHCPFFYGVVEISSVPLVVMNFMRGSRGGGVIESVYVYVRILFGVVFLLTRVVMWTPQIYDVLRCAVMLWYTCESNLCQLVTGTFCISSLCLTLLQYYWGVKIVRGILSIIIHTNTNKLE